MVSSDPQQWSLTPPSSNAIFEWLLRLARTSDMPFKFIKRALPCLVVIALHMPASAQDNGLVLYGAGSLRGAMSDVGAACALERGMAVRT